MFVFGGHIDFVIVDTDSSDRTTGSTEWHELAALGPVVVQAGSEEDLFLLTLSGSTYCSGTAANRAGVVRALADGKVMAPGEVSFDGAVGAELRQSHSHQFVSERLGEGEHNFKIQWRVFALPTGTTTFHMSHRILTLMRIG